MTQSVKCFAVSRAPAPVQKAGFGNTYLIVAVMEGGDKGILGTQWPDSLANW